MTPEERAAKMAGAVNQLFYPGAQIERERLFSHIRSFASDAIRFAEIDAIERAATVASEKGADSGVVEAIRKLKDSLQRSSQTQEHR